MEEEVTYDVSPEPVLGVPRMALSYISGVPHVETDKEKITRLLMDVYTLRTSLSQLEYRVAQLERPWWRKVWDWLQREWQVMRG